MKILKPIISASVACLMSTVAFGDINWKQNVVYYDCNGIKCELPVKSEHYTSGLSFKTPTAKGYRFVGWNLETRRYRRDSELFSSDHCALWVGQKGGSIVIPKQVKDFNWDGSGISCGKVGENLYWWWDGPDDAREFRGAIKAFAQWSKNKYSVSLYFNGGFVDNNAGATKNVSTGPDWTKKGYTIDDHFDLPRPRKTGYVFKGWCTTPQLSYCVNNPELYDDGDQNKIYYAKWDKAYTVTLEPGDGVLGSKSMNDGGWTKYGNTYVKDYSLDDNFTLPKAFRVGFSFDGWCTDKALKNCQKTVTVANATGNKTYYAKYTKIEALRQQNIVNTKVKLNINK